LPLPPAKSKVNSSPSPSLLRKILGGPISESVQNDWPELAKEWASAEVNMPEQTAMTDFIGPMGPVENMITKGASGRTALGRISLNRKAVTEDNNLKEVLQHELVHMGQKPQSVSGFLNSRVYPWAKRPEEQEAMTMESKFPRRMRDIYLPSEYDKKVKK
jgi:hypothetical protein